MRETRKLIGPSLWRALSGLAVIAMLALAGCAGDSTDSAGVDLGPGPLLAFIGADGNLWLARGDGSSPHAVSTTNCPPTVNCYSLPAWSPDGKMVAVFGPDKTTQSSNDIYVYDRKGILQNTIKPVNSLDSGQLLWSADSKEVAYSGRIATGTGSTATKSPSVQNAFIMMNVSSGTQAGTIQLPAPQGADAQCNDAPRGGQLGSFVDHAINGDSNGFRTTLSWSPDGSHVLVSGGNCGSQVLLVDKSGTSQVLAPVSTASNANTLQAVFSPDGQHILATETTTAQDDLLLYDANGANGKVIYSDTDAPPAFAPRLSSPTWSADGKMIYFMRGTDIWQIGSDASNATKVLAGASTGDPQKAETWPQPSPDGKSLVWVEVSLAQSDNIPRSALYIGDAKGGNPKLIENGAIWAVWSNQ
jgi:Tol biopolymer transport system component